MSSVSNKDDNKVAKLIRGGVGNQLRQLPILLVLIITLIAGGISNSFFLSPQNLINVLAQSAVLGVLVIAETLVLLVKRMDLSIEAIATLAPVVAVWLIVPPSIGGLGLNLGGYVALVITFAIGALVGVVNALLIVKARLNTFVVTLAMLILLEGVASGIAQGATFYDLPDEYIFLGNANWLGVPIAAWVAGALFVLVGLFLRFHRVGRSLYAIGGNEQAARAAGIRVDRILMGTFIASGLLAALAGTMLTGRLAAASASQAQNIIFSVIAACVIGGISLNGGRGRLVGALIGFLLLGVIQNLLTLSNIASYWITATYGLIILIALVIARIAGGEERA